MRLATTLCLAAATSAIFAAPLTGDERARSWRVQSMVVDLAPLHEEFHGKGWQRSFYVHLGDTWASFVAGQLNRLQRGDYTGLVPEVRELAEDLDDEAESGSLRDVRGGWEPVGWGDCDEDRELIVLKRRLR